MRPFHKYLVRAKVEPKEQALEAVIMKQHDKGTLSLLWRLRKQKKAIFHLPHWLKHQ